MSIIKYDSISCGGVKFKNLYSSEAEGVEGAAVVGLNDMTQKKMGGLEGEEGSGSQVCLS